MESLNQVWAVVADQWRSHMTEVSFNTFIRNLSLLDIAGGEATLFVRSPVQRELILKNFIPLLTQSFREVMGIDVHIKIVTEEDSPQIDDAVLADAGYEYTFDTFIVGSSNNFAYSAALAVTKNPGGTYNPLFIYGNSGLGKTHLLNAIYNRVKETFPHYKLVSVRAETFTRELLNAISTGTTTAFQNKYRTADLLLIDDIQFIAGKESTQEEFFNTFNALYLDRKQIVITSDRLPKDIATLDDRIKTRFEAGLMADIQPPDFETRVGIITRKSEMMQLKLSDEIVFYIAEQVKTNIRQLEGVVKKLHAMINLQGQTPPVDLAQTAIRDIRNDDQPEPITVRKIIEEVARTYAVSAADIISPKRDAPIANARKIAMYITREITQMPMKDIGREFGGRDHSTVVYSLHEIEKLIARNTKEKNTIYDIIKNMQN